MNSYSTHTTHSTAENELSRVLKILADPTRLRILDVLQNQGSHSVNDCKCHIPDVSQSLLSHHIADLRKAGLVVADKQGLKVYYSLTNQGQRVMAVLDKLKEDYPMNGCNCTNCTCKNCSC